jgi:signal transduction histidine kinase/DNA-binding response OmpR family regulator
VKSITFRWKLTLFIVLICGVSLSLAFAGLYIYDRLQFSQEVQRKLESTSKLLVSSLAKVLEQNPTTTDLGLNLVAADPQVAAAAVFSTDGKLLSQYVRAGTRESIPGLDRMPGLLSTERAVLLSPIRMPFGTRSFGTLYLKAELSQADIERSSTLLRGSAIIFLAAVLLAFVVAYRLQALVTQPIIELARVSADIQRERDYSYRVGAAATGEIGELIHSFNAMLDTIQSNTSELQRAKVVAEEARERIHQSNEKLEEANRTLEARVEDRTRLLAKAVDDAEEASKAKSTFLAKMSHELRTPLNAIIGYSEMLQEDARDEGATRTADDLDKVLNAARHLLGLINDVLDISKIEAGKMELFLETFPLSKIIGDVSATISPLIEKKRNQLVLDFPENIGTMHADATKLRQMLLNLLSNASKFTENGTITLRATRTTGVGNDIIEFAIIDTGIGMTPTQLSRLFQAFSQADASTASKYGGTGLGLAISKQFAQMMKGDITVSSIAGIGSTFLIRLPANVQSAQPKVIQSNQKLTHSPFAAQDQARILLIEDDKEVRQVLADLLTENGYALVQADSGQHGLDLAAQQVPDLIVLDASLSGVDGWTVLTKLQDNPKLSDVPVIILGTASDTDMALSLGATTIVSKPIDAARLTAEIAMLITPLGTNHVLVVEDDEDSRTLISRTLERENWPYRAVASGKAAFRTLQQSAPAVILLDLKMAGMNGFELLDRIQKNPAWSKIPVIVISSMDIAQETGTNLTPRALAILRKGQFSRDELADLIRPVIQSGQLAKT